jgi:hypothetical protein
VAPADVGEALAPGTGLDPADGEAFGLALDESAGFFTDGDPAWDAIDALWELIGSELVMDVGTCPWTEISGDATLFHAGCRSSQGYEWDGEATTRRWEDGDGDHERYELDLEVVGDVEDPRFERVKLLGQAERVRAEDVTHVDVNVSLEVSGYWERVAPTDPRLRGWAAWAVSGSFERAGDALRVEEQADIGGSGGFRLIGPELWAESACPIERAGPATLGDGTDVVFEGAAGCDACATVGGETAACAP